MGILDQCNPFFLIQVAKKDKEIFADAERLDVVNKAPIVLCELLFDDSMVTQVRNSVDILAEMTAVMV